MPICRASRARSRCVSQRVMSWKTKAMPKGLMMLSIVEKPNSHSEISLAMRKPSIIAAPPPQRSSIVTPASLMRNCPPDALRPQPQFHPGGVAQPARLRPGLALDCAGATRPVRCSDRQNPAAGAGRTPRRAPIGWTTPRLPNSMPRTVKRCSSPRKRSRPPPTDAPTASTPTRTCSISTEASGLGSGRPRCACAGAAAPSTATRAGQAAIRRRLVKPPLHPVRPAGAGAGPAGGGCLMHDRCGHVAPRVAAGTGPRAHHRPQGSASRCQPARNAVQTTEITST